MYKQLIDYASEARPHDVMTPIAREMTEPQMANVAFYYSVLDAAHARRPTVEPRCWRAAARSPRTACGRLACRPAISATARAVPAIRRCSPTLPASTRPTRSCRCSCTSAAFASTTLGVMRDIADGLSDEDIRAVALYFEWLRPAEDDGQGARVGARQRERTGG